MEAVVCILAVVIDNGAALPCEQLVLREKIKNVGWILENGILGFCSLGFDRRDCKRGLC